MFTTPVYRKVAIVWSVSAKSFILFYNLENHLSDRYEKLDIDGL